MKKYEAIPYVKTGVKLLLDEKEKELIKKRNSDLFHIKMLEKQLNELRKALYALEISAQPIDQDRLKQLENKIEETYHKTQTEEHHTLIL